MKDMIEKLQRDVASLVEAMGDKAQKGQDAEVKELSDKVTELQKELHERKQQFAVSQDTLKTGAMDRKEADRKLDELYIASAVLQRKDKSLDVESYRKVANSSDYRDAIKASGFDNDPTVPDGQVSGGDGTPANYGSDFIPEGFSSTLLEEIFLALEVADLFDRFPMPTPTFTFPFSADRITARKGLEGRAVQKDKLGTSGIQFVAKKLMSVVDFTDEVEADAVIAMLPFIRTKIIEGFALAQEQIIINGDTNDTNGINGALADPILDSDSEDARLVQKGLRALGIADGATVDFGGTGVTEDLMRDMRAALGKYGKKPGDLAYVISMNDFNQILKTFSNYQALHTYGSNAVIANGELARIDNIPLIISELIPDSGLDATGVYTDGIGDTGTILLANKNSMMWGDRKNFGLEMFRNPLTGQTSLIGSERLDLQKVVSAAATPIAVGINV